MPRGSSQKKGNPYPTSNNVERTAETKPDRTAAEKRKPSGSPPGNEIPATKRQPRDDSHEEILMDIGDIGAEVEVTGVVAVSADDDSASPANVLKAMQDLMQSTLDKITTQANEMRQKNDECIKIITDKNESCIQSVENLRNLVAVQGKSLDGVKSEINEAKGEINTLTKSLNDAKMDFDTQLSNLTTKTQELESKTENQKHEFSDKAKNYIATLENRIKVLEAAVINRGDGAGLAGPFPIDRTIMISRVYMKSGMTVEVVVRLILHGALKLVGLKIVNGEDMGVYFGKHTLKVELESPDALREVLDCKSLLGTSSLKDLRSVFIRRSRPVQERVHSHNYRVMMREMNIQGKYRTDRNGRLIVKSTQDLTNNAVEMETDNSTEFERSDSVPSETQQTCTKWQRSFCSRKIWRWKRCDLHWSQKSPFAGESGCCQCVHPVP